MLKVPHLTPSHTTTPPPHTQEVLLHEPIERLCWQFQPCTEEGEDFYSSLWLEYETTQGGKKVFKLLQVFSRQAPMMDALLGRCWDNLDKTKQAYVCMYNVHVYLRHPPTCICSDPSSTLTFPLWTYRSPTATSTPQQVHQSREHKLHCDEYSEEGKPPSLLSL